MTAIAKRQSFPSTPTTAGGARRFLDGALTGPGLYPIVDTAALLVSELVANAVLHGGTPLEVVVAVDGARVRVEVHDGSPRLPVKKNYSTMSGTGRGLVLVERMSSRWGADTTPTGKMVWFELDAATAPTIDLLGVDGL
ncbi:MAG: ATP-binding protein [Actinomycetota bacterium]|nr:ATP-binding protein [Actinomycetota bacterium]